MSVKLEWRTFYEVTGDSGISECYEALPAAEARYDALVKDMEWWEDVHLHQCSELWQDGEPTGEFGGDELCLQSTTYDRTEPAIVA